MVLLPQNGKDEKVLNDQAILPKLRYLRLYIDNFDTVSL